MAKLGNQNRHCMLISLVPSACLMESLFPLKPDVVLMIFACILFPNKFCYEHVFCMVIYMHLVRMELTH